MGFLSKGQLKQAMSEEKKPQGGGSERDEADYRLGLVSGAMQPHSTERDREAAMGLLAMRGWTALCPK